MASLCDLCGQRDGNISAIVKGVFYKHVCVVCNSKDQVSSGHARWLRSVDAEDHQFDLAQPYNADGTPNADFIMVYPEQSAAVFTKEQMDKAVRS